MNSNSNNQSKPKIRIFDTSLRDGEQAPGASLTTAEKLMVAEALDNMGVDIIEAGFAAASDGDFDAISKIAKQTKEATICSLARAVQYDIEQAGKAIKAAKQPRIHTFLSTSPLHREHKLKKNKNQVIEMIADSVAYARKFTDDVEWSPEDATRTEDDFLCLSVETAIRAGASTINIPDTVGYTTPDEMYNIITMLKNNVPNIDQAILSVHCHNDLGLAVANSLAAVKAGARQVECTINGIGERAGNAALEEIVMAIRTRPDLYPYENNINPTHIARVSRLVSRLTGFAVQKNKAIVGDNAFAHESGIHQDGMLKNAMTYEIMTPESVGWQKSNIVLGKHSGRHAFATRLKELGFDLGDNALEDAFARFKRLADNKKHIYDNDLIALLAVGFDDFDANSAISTKIAQLGELEVSCGSDGQKAKLSISVSGEKQLAEAKGQGPVDAVFNAIKKLIPHEAELQLYQVHAVTEGTDAQAEVTVRLADKSGHIVDGHAADIDTMIASATAYINALNHLEQIKERKVKAQKTEGI